MKILVAEDDEIALKFLTSALRKLDHEVIAARNGQEALDAFATHQPFIVISDWMMPLIDGLELCRRIRALPRDHYTFFILQTARNQREDYRLGMQAGVDDFLTKPVNREELSNRVRVAERMIHQRLEAEKKIRLLARFPSDNPNPVLQVDRDGRILYANDASLDLLVAWQSGVGGLAPEQLREPAALLFTTGQRQEVELRCANQVFSFSATSVSPDGVAYLYGHDITERKQAEQQLVVLKDQAEENALHDQLTGLPNRRLFGERFNQEIARAARQGTKLALVVVDIDNFKHINDSYGHRIGDQVIVAVGHCLCNQLRSSDTVCRWGGDELVLLLADLRDRSGVAAISTKLMAAVKQHTMQAEISAPVSISLGSALFPDDSREPMLLMQQADHALYVAKADGRDCWREFKGFPDGHDAKDKADLFIRLGAAVTEGRIVAVYQPIIDAETREVIGAEALARWHDEEYGWVSPDVFIPMAEDRGLIFQLGERVVTQALDQLVEWRRRGLELTVSVNLSKRQLLDTGFRCSLVQWTRQRELKPEWIILEVTERQSVLGHTLGRERLGELAAAGFRLSIDDFGSGYSSFEVVGETSFSELKIHLGLIRQSNTPRGRRILQAIVEMGRTLQLRVVAEGVEEEVTQELLTSLGVNKLQGYLFSKPLEPAAFIEFVESYNARTRRAA
jgi:diguanylate cyclase (GGDEF)-like protein